MPETWQCGHCPLQVAIPDELTNHDGYIDTIVLIREHRFGHIADAFMRGTTEAIMGLVDDDPHSLLNSGPVVEFHGRSYVAFPTDLPTCVGDPDQVIGPDPGGWPTDEEMTKKGAVGTVVTNDDVIPALAEADRLVRGGRP